MVNWNVNDLLPGQTVSPFEREQVEMAIAVMPLGHKFHTVEVADLGVNIGASLRGDFNNGWTLLLNRMIFRDPTVTPVNNQYTPTYILLNSVAHEVAGHAEVSRVQTQGDQWAESLFSIFGFDTLRHWAKINGRAWREPTSTFTIQNEGMAEILEEAVYHPSRFLERTLDRERDAQALLTYWQTISGDPFPQGVKEWEMGEQGFFGYLPDSEFFEDAADQWARTPLGLMEIQAWPSMHVWQTDHWESYVRGFSWMPGINDPIPEGAVCYRQTPAIPVL